MKNILHYILLLALGMLGWSCEKDNYEPPSSQLTGQLLYQGTPLQLQHDRVSYELYQDGFGKRGPISSTFTTEGAFSHLLFNGLYKMVVPVGQGPFVWSGSDQGDTLLITVNGNTEMDIEVTPYWMVRNSQFSASGGNVTGTFGLEQIITDANARTIENATLYVSKTIFASSENNIAIGTIEGGAITDMNSISLSATVPELVPAQSYVFARIGVKIAGIEDMIFSPVQKIDL